MNKLTPTPSKIISTVNTQHATTLAVLQPGYMPWLGFFDQMQRSDIFVIYDDVQYDKNGWRNRNRIKSITSQPHWLTIPVRVHLGQRILDVEIDNSQDWARKHLATIVQFYKQAQFFDAYYPQLEELLLERWERIVDLDMALIYKLKEWLDIDTCIVRASELGVEGDRNERLLNLCLSFDATTYLSGNAAQDYLDVQCFEENNVKVEWQNYSHPVYPQLHGAFIPFLSVLDLLLNCGNSSSKILAGQTS